MSIRPSNTLIFENTYIRRPVGACRPARTLGMTAAAAAPPVTATIGTIQITTAGNFTSDWGRLPSHGVGSIDRARTRAAAACGTDKRAADARTAGAARCAAAVAAAATGTDVGVDVRTTGEAIDGARCAETAAGPAISVRTATDAAAAAGAAVSRTADGPYTHSSKLHSSLHRMLCREGAQHVQHDGAIPNEQIRCVGGQMKHARDSGCVAKDGWL